MGRMSVVHKGWRPSMATRTHAAAAALLLLFGCAKATAPNVDPAGVDLPQGDAAAEELRAAELPPPCQRECEGRECGGDGCGGECGQCGEGFACDLGTCREVICEPWLLGGECLSPTSYSACSETGMEWVEAWCEAPLICYKGGCVAPCLESGRVCSGTTKVMERQRDEETGACRWVVVEDCSPGHCTWGGVCVCDPWCAGKQCGDDGCGGLCGECPAVSQCQSGWFCTSWCSQACQGKQCGPDGCGGLCGTCQENAACNDEGKCVVGCVPDCKGKYCGSDGCGGHCPLNSYPPKSCPPGSSCQDGKCQLDSPCVPSCEWKECGDDGCGGSCGECPAPILCSVAGFCGDKCSDCNYADPSCLDFDFSSGSLADWVVHGAKLVTHLGYTWSRFGGYMLRLDTAAQTADLPSEAARQVCLAPGKWAVLVRWKLYSEELKEWCGSNYQDEFVIEVEQPGGTKTIALVDIDSVCSPVECTCAGEYFTELYQSQVIFDQGDVWNTAWVDMFGTFDVADEPGLVTVRLALTAAGDSIFHTVVLVDRLRFVLVDDLCDIFECGPDPWTNICGGCPTGSVCQFGECCLDGCHDQACGEDSCGTFCGNCPGGG